MINNNAEVDDHALDRLMPEIRCRYSGRKDAKHDPECEEQHKEALNLCVKHARNNQCTIFMKRRCP